jgi:hypothetical protein
MKKFYCKRCCRWHGEASKSEREGFCFHCWRFICEYGWDLAANGREVVPARFTWRGVLAPVVVNRNK